MSERRVWGSLRKYNGSARKLFRFADKRDKMWSAFNPSIAKNPDGEIAMVVRSSNYLLGPSQKYNSLTVGPYIQNRVWFAELDDDLRITDMYELECVGELSFKRGVEDGRLFWRDGGWWMTGVILEKPHTPVARTGLFKIDTAAKTATLVEKYPGIADNVVEKNWGVVAGEAVSQFDYIYSPNSIYKDGKFVELDKPGKFKGIRGGTQLIPWDGGYLSVGHITRSMLSKEPIFNPTTYACERLKLRHYTHVFIKYDLSGRMEKISEEFIFNVEGIEFAAGIIEHKGRVYISYGHDDIEGWMASLDVDTVREMLR